MDSHGANLERVRTKLAHAILLFAATRRLQGKLEFRGEELREYVNKVSPGAPGSPDRVLRDLRQRGFVRYELLSRRDSLYRLMG